jgi:RND family efflux transporter MFP subunit
MAAPQELRVAIPVQATWHPTISLDGTLQASKEVDLSFKAQGKVAWLGAKVGDVVEKGAALARLETDEASLSVRTAEANTRAMEAALALSEDTERRTVALVEGGAQAQAVGVQATKQSSLSRAQLDGARAQLALSRAVLSGFTIVAPFRGTVLQAPTAAGFSVAPPGMGAPVFKLADTDTLRIVGTVNDNDAALLHVGDEIQLRKGDKTYKGNLTVILPRVDPQTRRRNVEAELKNDGSSVLAVGALAQADIWVQQPVAVVRIPAVALRRGSQDEVFVVIHGELGLRRIRYAVDADGSLLVREGITKTDLVVLDPKTDAKDGERVQPVEERR